MKTLLLSIAFAGALFAQDAFQVKVSGHGQPMILIPGMASSGESWDTTVTHYQDRYECHVLTLAGFAGVPPVKGPMLDRVRDGVAAYIRQHKLQKPVIVGHSLGGFVALAIGAKYPDLPGKLVIVDAYPYFGGLMKPGGSPAEIKEMIAQMAGYMRDQDPDQWVRMAKSGALTRTMVTKDSDLDRLIAWGVASDRTTVTESMIELYSADLRADLAAIRTPALVMASWIAYKSTTDHQKTEASLRAQYAKLSGVQIAITDTARHFIMWDDPNWMFSQMDPFLASGLQAAVK